MAKRRVVVTGMGILSPVGNTVEGAWENILAGKSGIGPVTDFDASAFSTQFAGLVKDFDAANYYDAKDAKKQDLFIQYGIASGVEAMRDSGLEITEENADRVGLAIGSGIGGLQSIEDCRDIILEKGPRRISPFFVPGSIINMISGNLSIMFGMH